MQAWREPLADGRAVELRATGRAEGDLSVGGPVDALRARRSAVVDRPWAAVRQVHSGRVEVVDDRADLDRLACTEADALVTTRADVALAVQGADCGVLGLWSPEGVVAVAHAGWRGLEVGILPATVDRMRALGAGAVSAVAGPCIGPECYEFSPAELDRLERSLGHPLRGTTAWGTPALDLPAAISAVLGDLGVQLVAPPAVCTACAEATHWSHRARGDEARQALVLWIDGPQPASAEGPEGASR